MFFPSIAVENHILPFVDTQQIVAIGILILLTWVNTLGVRTGSVVQNVFTIAKVAALAGLIVFETLVGRNEAAVARNFRNSGAAPAGTSTAYGL